MRVFRARSLNFWGRRAFKERALRSRKPGGSCDTSGHSFICGLILFELGGDPDCWGYFLGCGITEHAIAEGQVGGGGWGYRRWEIWSSVRMVKTLLPLGVSAGSGSASRDATMFSISLTESF